MIEPNIDAATAFLDALEPGGRFCFQTFDDSVTKRQSLVWQGHGTLDDHALHLADLNEAGAGIFVTVNRTDGQGRKEANITGIRALFIDGDDQDMPTEWHKPPSIIVTRDARHWHAYWVLRPVSEDLEFFKGAQMALIERYKTDAKIKDLPRVMRIPGFLHRKQEPVMVTSEQSANTYAELDEITASLARPEKAPRVTADAIMHRALARATGGRNDAGFWLACQLRDNRYSENEADAVLSEFVRLVPQSGAAGSYSAQEAAASVRQAYKQAPREPWSKGTSPAPAVVPVDDIAASEPVTLQANVLSKYGINLDTSRWCLSDKGVLPMEYKEGAYTPNYKRVVAGRPIWPRRLGVDPTGRLYVDLAWHNSRGTVSSKWIARESLASRDTLFSLTDAPVSLGRINPLSDYLVDACGGITADHARVTTHLGWAGDQWVWAGDADYNYIGNDIPKAGDLSEWAEGLQMLLAEERLIALGCLGMSAAAPLVRLLGCRSPVLGLEEHSSTGKSTVIRYAISAWTSPDLLTLPASSTAKGIQDKSMWMPDGPLLIEDVQQLDERDQTAVADVIYFIANGQRRVTSTRSQESTGGEKRYGCAFYAAERSVLGNMNLGVQYRVVQLSGSPLESAQEAAVLAGCTRHAGAPAAALSAIYQQESAECVARVRELAAGIEFRFKGLKGNDLETMAMIQVGLELLGRVCGCDVNAAGYTTRLCEMLQHKRKLTCSREEEALTALISRLECCDWSEGGILEVREEWVAQRLVNNYQTTGYDINTQSDLVQRTLAPYGTERRLTDYWKSHHWIAEQKGRTKIVSTASGRARRVLRVTKNFLVHIERGQELITEEVK